MRWIWGHSNERLKELGTPQFYISAVEKKAQQIELSFLHYPKKGKGNRGKKIMKFSYTALKSNDHDF